MPGLGTRRDELRPGLMMWVIFEFLILYQAESGGILIVRVVRGRRNLKKLFSTRGAP